MLLTGDQAPTPSRPPRLPRLREQLSLTAVFALLALRYWLTVFPRATLEIRRLRAQATTIGDPTYRRLALAALSKQSNLEGAAAFAALVPRAARASATRALVAFQSIYNYADILAERPWADDDGAVGRAHAALLLALNPRIAPARLGPADAPAPDRDYLLDQIESCRGSLSALPSVERVISPALMATGDIWAFQARSSQAPESFESWARERPAQPHGMSWWESAGAAGSSLTVHALIAAAGQRTLDEDTVERLVAAYGGPIGALHSLLDSLIDESEDACTAQVSLVGFYRTRSAAATAMGEIAQSARCAARGLPQGRRHAVLVAAMASLYLSDPQARAPGAAPVTRSVRVGIGALATPALAVFALRRAIAPLGRASAREHAPAAQRADADSPADVCARGR